MWCCVNAFVILCTSTIAIQTILFGAVARMADGLKIDLPNVPFLFFLFHLLELSQILKTVDYR